MTGVSKKPTPRIRAIEHGRALLKAVPDELSVYLSFILLTYHHDALTAHILTSARFKYNTQT